MKKILILFLLFACLTLQAATYYVTPPPTGVDGAGRTGAISQPFATINYAVSRAVSGDIIHVNPGTHTNVNQNNLNTGISIEGEGITSVILSNVLGDYSFVFRLGTSTEPEGTNGNQHISGIKFIADVSNTKYFIGVFARKNVEIYNCYFENSENSGVMFYGKYGAGNGAPTIYATGNKFYNNTMVNCGSGAAGDVKSNLSFAGQDGMLIYNNTITQPIRSNGWAGVCIKSAGDNSGHNKNVKIYGNTLTAPATAYDGIWDFTIELWDSEGGVEIYNNTCYNSSIDIGGYYSTKGTSTYSVWVHDNIIGCPALSSVNDIGIIIEGSEGPVSDIIIERNLIKNINVGISFQPYGGGSTYENIRVSYNIFDNIGMSLTGFQGTKGFSTAQLLPAGSTINNLMIYNNIFRGAITGATPVSGILLPNKTGNTVSNVYIRNNIFVNWQYPTYASAGGTITGLYIQKNIMYGNANDEPIFASPWTYTLDNGLFGQNPLFIDDLTNFHLSSTSPAVNAGYDVDLPMDYDSITVNAITPEIGAYEFLTVVPSVPATVTTTQPSKIGSTSATAGGNVTDAGGGTVSARGVVWSTSPLPTIDSHVEGDYTTNGTGTGEFTSAVTGLVRLTTYYLRAYVINDSGGSTTSYGEQKTFKTIPYLILTMSGGSGGGGGVTPSGTVTSVATGLGLTGGTITTTGTIALDTASVSVISRQRAANTYEPRGKTGVFNVLDYGADSTGAANSTTAIQAAIDAAGNGTVIIPAGEYLVTALTIKTAVKIVGAGWSGRYPQGTTLKTVTAQPVFTFSNITGQIYSDGASITDLMIWGDNHADGAAKQTGMVFDTEANILIQRVRLYLLGDYGIRLGTTTHTTKIKISDCIITQCGKGGIYGRVIDAAQINAIHILHNEINDNRGFGINIIGTNIIMRENIIQDNDSSGIFMSARDMANENCSSANTLIDGNWIEANDGGNIYIDTYYDDSPEVYQYHTGIEISNNNFVASLAGIVKPGVSACVTVRRAYSSEVATSTINDLHFRSNNYFSVTGGVVWFDGGSILNYSCVVEVPYTITPTALCIGTTGGTVTVNGVPSTAPVANATTISAASGIVIRDIHPIMIVTMGSAIDITAVPQIAAGFNGQKILIIGSSDANTLTLDDGNGLILAGGASCVLGLTDIIELVYVSLANAWVETKRSDN